MKGFNKGAKVVYVIEDVKSLFIFFFGYLFFESVDLCGDI